ncbi:MAG: hypothetical protein H6815_02235 [Phycisphaeraceae bacterium]|nr:hypothetical protein [Phycisphaerales bacterium]MCB9859246.1 hypothetical protein [Phycisphaeraceae bacterium]
MTVINKNPQERATAPIYAAMRSRVAEVSSIKILNTTPTTGQRPTLGLPGSMMVFLSKGNSQAIEEVRTAAIQGGERAASIFRHLKKQFACRKTLPIGEAIELISKQSVFAELRYGGNILASGLAVPDDLDYTVLVLPYNGGRLAPEGFELVEYLEEPGQADRLQGIVIQVTPDLSEAEAELMKAQNDMDRWRNVAYEFDCDTTAWAVAAAFAIGVTVGLAVTCAGCVVPDLMHLDQSDIDRLGPSASVQELLQLRHQYLRQMVGYA